MRSLTIVAALVSAASVAGAQEGPVRVSIGYAFVQYLEEGGGNVPVGAYLSVSSTGKVGFEGDVGYHRDSREIGPPLFISKTVFNTLTLAAGPRFETESERTKRFVHILGGLRYDHVKEEFDPLLDGLPVEVQTDSNTALGGMVGGGMDVPVGQTIRARIGADFQIFFDEGENLKTLRLIAGISF